MNILDFLEPDNVPDCVITGIFERHIPLMERYRVIEVKNGFHYPDRTPLDLHDKKDQHLLKDFKWRVTEELMEAREAYRNQDEVHYLEELSDALHFLVETCVLAGVTPRDILQNKDPVSPQVLDVIYFLGLAANCLKNKPWKEHHLLTDVTKYRGYLVQAFICLYHLFPVEENTIYSLYFRKNQVNDFRIKSKY